ncbi:MAG: preprotein translocase subunit SecY [Candidatus Diapherotrites archaeon]
MNVLDIFEPVYKLLPEVKVPETKPTLQRRLIWTGAVLMLFFIMGNIAVIGLNASSAGQLEQLQVILASKIGTILTVGIGPIVLASIILQLLVGGKILNIDLSQPKDKARFTALQKLFAIVLCFFEAGVYVMSGFLSAEAGMLPFVILQVALGAIVLMYMDEVVSKYGIGSGIGLFIAGGVSEVVIWRMFNPFNIAQELVFFGGQGLLWLFMSEVTQNLLNAMIYLLPVFFTLVVFFVVVFAEGMHVNIPITMGRRGTGGRFPVKFLYVSNIPVILAVALFANVRMWATLGKDLPIVGAVLDKIGTIVIPPYSLVENIIIQFGSALGAGFSGIIGFAGTTIGEMAQSIVSLSFIGIGGSLIHAFLYIIILVIVCVVFGKFWVEMGGQGSEAVANQLNRAGMHIPGFRRDPRIVRGVLDRYIPPISVLGSAFVALLAGFADLTGALGSGTGILLTVGIVYRLYEELARAQLMDMHPMLGKLFG